MSGLQILKKYFYCNPVKSKLIILKILTTYQTLSQFKINFLYYTIIIDNAFKFVKDKLINSNH